MKLRNKMEKIILHNHNCNVEWGSPCNCNLKKRVDQLLVLFKQTMGEVRREVNEEEEIDFKKEKYCPNCRKIKLKSQFRSNVARHDGVSQYCKACMRIKSKTNYELYYKSLKNKL